MSYRKFSLSKEDRKYLANVVAEVEQNTSGEVRLVLVRRSSPPATVAPAVWLILVVMSLLAILSFRFETLLHFRWWWVPSIMVLAIPIAWVLSRVNWVERRFLSPLEIRHHIWTRAELEFYREGLKQTEGQTGVLLFLSIFERSAVVLADKAINDRIGTEKWNEIIYIITSASKDGKWREHLERAIRECGLLLSQHFPKKSNDRNELADEIVIKD